MRWIPIKPQPERIADDMVQFRLGGEEESKQFLVTDPKDSEHEWQMEEIIKFAPFAVGGRIPVREEWRVIAYSSHKGIQIEYGDGKKIWYKDYKESQFNWLMSLCINEWAGPVDEMPDFAVRKWETVVSVEAKQAVHALSYDDIAVFDCDHDTWGWLIEVSDEQ